MRRVVALTALLTLTMSGTLVADARATSDGFRQVATGSSNVSVAVDAANHMPGLASGASPDCVPKWTRVPTPNHGGIARWNYLHAVAATSASNAWAVGYYSNGTANQTLTLHWDGTGWTTVASPNPGGTSNGNGLSGVAATSASNAWAVGFYNNGTADRTLILHWDGTSWTSVASPNPGGSSNHNYLSGVAATSASNAWAVGYYNNGTVDRTLILHWNGAGWTRIASPNPGGSSNHNYLTGVAATSASNAWAVGYYSDGTVDQTLILHWNGAAWTRVASPSPAGNPFGAWLNAVAATSASNAWAVGEYSAGIDEEGDVYQSLILRWNGTRWTRVASPSPGWSTRLYGVAATSASDAWAVGTYDSYLSLILHWNGTRWTRVAIPNPGGGYSNGNGLSAVATSASSAWAVGSYEVQTLILHWHGTRWTRVASPRPMASTNDNFLSGVAATSASDAWAVGSYDDGTAYPTLILHWNGADWTGVANPDVGVSSWSLRGVAATSASNAWAVGSYNNGTADRTLILHWDGARWTRVASPNAGGSSLANYLTGVAATSASDAWAVGWYRNGTVPQTLILHWDGTSWTRVASPNAEETWNYLTGVAATSPSDAWAVGWGGTGDGALILHWDGTSWTWVARPDFEESWNYLTGVAATSALNAWAVGYAESSWGDDYVDETLILHWDGTSWTRDESPNPGWPYEGLYGVAATSASNAWAVGYYDNATLILHWDGTSWTSVASPNPGGASNYLSGVAATSASNAWAVGSYSKGAALRTLAIRWH